MRTIRIQAHTGKRLRRRWIAIVLSQVLLGGALLALAEPAAATTTCSPKWHIIKASAMGRNVQFRYDQNSNGLSDVAPFANGIAGVEPWNQFVLFCRDPGWGQNQYGIKANFSGLYCGPAIAADNYQQFSCGYGGIYNLNELFEIVRYDAKFWTIRHVGRGGWLSANSQGEIYQLGGQLNGYELFEIDGTPPNQESHP